LQRDLFLSSENGFRTKRIDLHLENREDRIVSQFYYCFAILIGLWILWPLVVTEFHAKKMGPWGFSTIAAFFLLRSFRKLIGKKKEGLVADSSWISKSAPPSLDGSNCGKPFGKDPDNGKRCCVPRIGEDA
jgi:hypothetical protein